MVTGPLTEAHIELEMPVDGAERDLDQLDARLEALEQLAESGAEGFVDSFRDAIGDVRQEFDQIVRNSGLDDLGREAEQQARRITRAMEAAGRLSDEALDQIGGADAFVDLVLQAQAAGKAIDVAFRDAGGRLRDGHGKFIPAGTFSGVVVEGSAAAREIAVAFEAAGVVSRDALRDIGGPDTFGPAVASADAAARQIERQFKDAANDSERSLARVGGAFKLLATGAGVAAVGIGLAGAAVTAFGVKGAAQIEQTRIGFEALLGSAEEADAFIREMQQFAARTPFEFQGLAENTRKLLAVSDAAGIAREELLPTVETIGDLTAVLGAPPDAIDRVVRALGQMASRGKVSTQEMLQLSEALPGFAPFQAMADGLGITTGELQEQIERGLIPATEGIDLLLEGMKEFPGAAGAMAKQAQTLTGLFSTFKDTIQISLTNAFQPLIPTLKTALADAIPVIEAGLTTIAPALSDLAGGLVSTLVDVFDALGPSFGVGLQGLADGLSSIFEGVATNVGLLRPVFEALGPFLAQVGEILQPIVGLFATLAGTVLPPVINLMSGLLTVLEPVIDTLAAGLSDLIVNLSPLFTQLSGSFTAVLQTLVPVLEDLARVFVEAFGALEPLIPPINQFIAILAEGLMEAITILGPALEDIAQAWLDAFIEVIDSIGPGLPELARSLASIAVSLAEILAALTPLIVPLFKLASIFVKINTVTYGLAVGGVALLLGALADVVTFVSENAGPAFDTLMGLLDDLWNNILVPLGEFIAGTFVTALVGLGEILGGALMIAVEAISTAAGFLWNSVLVPLGDFLWTVLQPALLAIAAVMFGPLAVAVTAVSIAANALWNFILVPFGRMLVETFGPAVSAAADVLSLLFRAAIEGVTIAAGWLWNSVLVPFGGFLSSVFSAAIDVAKLAFEGLKAGVGLVTDAASWLWNTVLVPFGNFLEDTLAFTIGVATSAFGLMQSAIDLVSAGIETLIGWIETAIGWVDDLIDKIGSIPGGGVVGDIVGAIPGVGAEGGIFTRATNMIIGEAGKEVLLPLTDPARTLALANQSGLWDVLAAAQGSRGASGVPAAGRAVSAAPGDAGATILNFTTYVAGPVSDVEADRVGERIGKRAAEVLDEREARVQARIA